MVRDQSLTTRVKGNRLKSLVEEPSSVTTEGVEEQEIRGRGGQSTKVVMAGAPGAKGDVGTPGPEGPPGPPGPGAAGNYTHHQTIASDVWLVSHDLGFKPNFSVYDSAGTQMAGFSVNHLDVNNAELIFGFAFGGEAEAS